MKEQPYEPVIGLEIHVALSTKTKLFCSCKTGFGEAPNRNICPVCAGMPGALPVMNRTVVEYAVAVGLSLHCDITRFSRFDRKNYFYPDNPQGYQISQLYLPIATNGYVGLAANKASKEASVDNKKPPREVSKQQGTKKRLIRIHEIHIEDDAGKLRHLSDAATSDVTLVDYNRSGIPLLEIVTEPDFRSADEVIAFLETLRLTLLYLGVSDCKLQEGSLRVDVNLSVHKPGTPYGTRTETKNLNSFRSITHAIEHEAKRQIDLIASGQSIQQESRRFDDTQGCSVSMRGKEDTNDYRYFPEPDLLPLRLSDEDITRIRASLPELRDEKLARYQRDYALSAYDAELITSYKKLSDLFEETIQYGASPKKTANRLMVDALSLCRSLAIHPEDITLSSRSLASLLAMTEDGRITGRVSKELFALLFQEDFDPEQYAKEHHLLQRFDSSYLMEIVEQVIRDNPQSVSDYKNGKTKACAFLVGQAMKKSHGTLNPETLQGLFEEKIL